MQDIEQFANMNTILPDNSTNCLIHCEVNPPNRSLTWTSESMTNPGLDGDQGPTLQLQGRECCFVVCAKADTLFVDPSLYGLPIRGKCRSSEMEGRHSMGIYS